MSGYRVQVGWGPHTDSANPDVLPEAWASDLTQAYGTLNKRFGAGAEITVNVNRNPNYLHDLGIRGISVATPGTVECDFTINCTFVPEYAQEWMKYAFASSSSKATYSATGGGVDKTIVKAKDALTPTQTSYHYTQYNTPFELFDICYVKHNKSSNDTTTKFKGGKNEIGVLCGCVINQLTFKYESASSDASVKCTIEGFALCPYVQFKDNAGDFTQESVSAEVLAGGCVMTDSNGEAIAQTDSAEVIINNNITRRGNCLKLTASSYTLGALEITVNTSTYSNNPEKYVYALYGENDGTSENVQTMSKKINKVKDLRIISTDSTSVTDQKANVSNALEIVLKDVFIGNLNYEWSVENPIMDNPELRPTDVGVIVTTTVPRVKSSPTTMKATQAPAEPVNDGKK